MAAARGYWIFQNKNSHIGKTSPQRSRWGILLLRFGLHYVQSAYVTKWVSRRKLLRVSSRVMPEASDREGPALRTEENRPNSGWQTEHSDDNTKAQNSSGPISHSPLIQIQTAVHLRILNGAGADVGENWRAPDGSDRRWRTSPLTS
jgi:hypothetical protein